MRFVIQRVSHASVTVDGKVLGKIGTGFMVLIGVEEADTIAIADKMISKLVNMRIFQDENDKMNLSLKDVDGGLLLISQFTLYADCKKGNRPSFTGAGGPDMASKMYDYIIAECKKEIDVVEQGEFGADMKVELLNDGPVTIILDSKDIMPNK
jgi:D-tyrosyl-tRNA(Tyr) deacylase